MLNLHRAEQQFLPSRLIHFSKEGGELPPKHMQISLACDSGPLKGACGARVGARLRSPATGAGASTSHSGRPGPARDAAGQLART